MKSHTKELWSETKNRAELINSTPTVRGLLVPKKVRFLFL